MSDINPMAMMSKGLGAIGGIVGAGASIYQANKNYDSQRETNAMQIDLANTAVQRRQADLAKAGINPLMAGKLGGAETPTLQAPQMHGYDRAGEQIGNIPRNMQAMQQTAMQIEQTKAETDNIQAQKDKAIADALAARSQANKTNVEAEWIPKTAKQRMDLEASQQHLAEAEKQTNDALREPQVKNLVVEAIKKSAEVGLVKAQTQTEDAKAKYAVQQFGANAKIAEAIASQAVEKAVLENSELKNKINKLGAEIELLGTQKFHALVELILRNKYGDQQEYAKIFNTPWQLPAAFTKSVVSGTSDTRVIKKDFRNEK